MMRAFICLSTPSIDGLLGAFIICAHDRASALAIGTAMLNEQSDGSCLVVGVLTQEEVSGMGMLLAAGRASLSMTMSSGTQRWKRIVH